MGDFAICQKEAVAALSNKLKGPHFHVGLSSYYRETNKVNIMKTVEKVNKLRKYQSVMDEGSVSLELTKEMIGLYEEIYNNRCSNMFRSEWIDEEISCDNPDCDDECPICSGMGFTIESNQEYVIEEKYIESFNFIKDILGSTEELDKIIDELEYFCGRCIETGKFDKSAEPFVDLLIDRVVEYVENYN